MKTRTHFAHRGDMWDDAKPGERPEPRGPLPGLDVTHAEHWR